MILFIKRTAATLYDVSKLMLSPIVTWPGAQQQHKVWLGGTHVDICGTCLDLVVGGPTHYVVTPNSCWSWVGAVTISKVQMSDVLKSLFHLFSHKQFVLLEYRPVWFIKISQDISPHSTIILLMNSASFMFINISLSKIQKNILG